MERKDQQESHRNPRWNESQQQDSRSQQRNERHQFGDGERMSGQQFGAGRDQWEGESGRQYERGGTGYGRQSYTAGQSGQGYYGARSGEEWRGGSDYSEQSYASGQSGQSSGMREDLGSSGYGGGAGGSYGYGRQGYATGQSGQGYSGAQNIGFESGAGYAGSQRPQTMGQHVGRGPRNYLRSDERIKDDVCRRLTEDPHVDASNIDVSVSDREVTLTGTVSSREERRKAEDCAEQIAGVSHVQNNIRVSRSGGGWLSSGRDSDREITRDESDSLISSEKVEGTAVYGSDRQKIGSIESVMLTKRSGKVAYAVLSFGGFLGMGQEHYPLPWRMLKYDTELGGYIVNLTKDQLQGAPKFSQSESWDWTNPATSQQVDRYYDRWMF